MLEENKNLENSLKDPELKSLTSYGTGSLSMPVTFSYAKLNKLITALYMVTDIMDKEEPLRNKLRTLGVNILSDTKLVPDSINNIISLLDIASAVRMISEMNCNILKKEFSELKRSIQESNVQNNPMWLEEFLNSPLEEYPDFKSGGGGYTPRLSATPQEGNLPPRLAKASHPSRGESIPIGHDKPTSSRLGVQKGSTLMKALKGFEGVKTANGFDVLKKQRRELISKIIKDKPEGASIKDIVLALRSFGEKWGEKTLQRELVSMTHDGVLNKTGEKRWSRYSIK